MCILSFFFFFLNGGEIFWSWFWIPQRWWMFLLISIVIVKSIRKGWYTEKKIHQIFLHRVWMLFLFYFLSCIAVYLPAWRIWTHSTSFTRAFFALNFVGVKAIMLYSDVSHECLAESAPAARHSRWSPNRLHLKHTPVEGFINFNGWECLGSANRTFLRAFFVKFDLIFLSVVSFKLIGPTSVLSLSTITITVSNENRCVQFYGFNHEYQRQNVHFVET